MLSRFQGEWEISATFCLLLQVFAITSAFIDTYRILDRAHIPASDVEDIAVAPAQQLDLITVEVSRVESPY